ncbi:hypothetical protein HU200_019926 [Digitaria exilis]|uniref:F-box domain-containing protein n=1 Tax=Digitaria exilis TaxID=1010633 RepID=A0A835KGI1_9POAL|nr:hypothetical protein HU200_019926 [Digitaria exilis]CAB3463378.1 unnamed protein product [Digitaria exilis]
MAPIRRALPLPDELIENILSRVASPRDLVFASAAHPDLRRIIAGASFPRRRSGSGLPADSVVLPELAVFNPFTRGYTLLPRILDSLIVAHVPVSYECVSSFQALFVPSGGYEDAHFRAVAWTCNHAMVVVSVYSSLSGTWAAGTSSSWDAPGLNVNIMEAKDWLPSYVYGCFYWQVPCRNKLLKLNMDRMEFSAVGLPPDYANRWVAVVESGEGRVGIFTRTSGIPRFLQYSIRQNEGENAIEHSEETTIPLSRDCKSYCIIAVAEGYIFLRGVLRRTPESVFFTLEIKTLKVERLGSICRGWALPYFGYPRFLSPRRI